MEEENKVTTEEITTQEQPLTEEQIKEIYEKAQAALEAARLPLETSTSSDTIQRVRAIIDVLNLKISYPKYVEETHKGQLIRKPTGSYEVSVFPNFGNSEEDSLFIRQTFTDLLNRVVKLAKTL